MPQAHILIVEDDENDVVLIRRSLQKSELRNSAVNDGQSALDYLAGTGAYGDRKKYPFPNLVLLDLNLPDLSGFEVLTWIRNQAALENLRVVVLTSSNELRAVNGAYSRGANSFLVKPLEFDNMDALLNTLKAQGVGL